MYIVFIFYVHRHVEVFNMFDDEWHAFVIQCTSTCISIIIQLVLTIFDCFQDVCANSVLTNNYENKCIASTNSFFNYGQFTILQSGLELIMYSMANAHSTINFSVMLINDNDVDSPPNGRKHLTLENSPFPLKCHLQSTLPLDWSAFNTMRQRKL